MLEVNVTGTESWLDSSPFMSRIFSFSFSSCFRFSRSSFVSKWWSFNATTICIQKISWPSSRCTRIHVYTFVMSSNIMYGSLNLSMIFQRTILVSISRINDRSHSDSRSSVGSKTERMPDPSSFRYNRSLSGLADKAIWGCRLWNISFTVAWGDNAVDCLSRASL